MTTVAGRAAIGQEAIGREAAGREGTGQAGLLARFGRALADPTRARVLLVLRAGPAYPAVLAEELGVSRTNLSNHLACLRGCGLVVAVAEGRRSRYELSDPRLAPTLDALAKLTGFTGGEDQEGDEPTNAVAGLPAGDPSICPDAPTMGCC